MKKNPFLSSALRTWGESVRKIQNLPVLFLKYSSKVSTNCWKQQNQVDTAVHRICEGKVKQVYVEGQST